MSVTISRAVHDGVLAAARISPDIEVCGLLFGTASHIENFQILENISKSLCDHFEIDPKDLIVAHKAQRAGGPQIIGHFHSHPNGALRPSSQDEAAAAGGGQIWIIVADERIGVWSSPEPEQLRPVAFSIVD
jgi:desampylase